MHGQLENICLFSTSETNYVVLPAETESYF